jgi:hypothetical protein
MFGNRGSSMCEKSSCDICLADAAPAESDGLLI